MTADHPDNDEQVRYWNDDAGPRWVAMQERLDEQLRPFGERAMEALALRPGASVLDVGTGCGATAIELARRVGPGGRVLGVDISSPMLERARERAAARSVANVTFRNADPQTTKLDGAPFDAVFSRFGVMFFDDPPRAFGRIRETTRVSGSLAFCCWRSRQDNDWLAGAMRIAAQHLEMPPPPADPHAPGPFGLFDRDRTRGILRDAGWKAVSVEPFDVAMVIGGATLDEAVDYLVRLSPIGAAMPSAPPAAQERLLTALRAHFEPHLGPEGVVMNGATWIVTATN